MKLNSLEGKFYDELISVYTFTVSQAKDISKRLAKICEKEIINKLLEATKIQSEIMIELREENASLKQQLSKQKHLSYEEVEKIIHSFMDRHNVIKAKVAINGISYNAQNDYKENYDIAITAICNLALPIVNDKVVEKLGLPKGSKIISAKIYNPDGTTRELTMEELSEMYFLNE